MVFGSAPRWTSASLMVFALMAWGLAMAPASSHFGAVGLVGRTSMTRFFSRAICRNPLKFFSGMPYVSRAVCASTSPGLGSGCRVGSDTGSTQACCRGTAGASARACCQAEPSPVSSCRGWCPPPCWASRSSWPVVRAPRSLRWRSRSPPCGSPSCSGSRWTSPGRLPRMCGRCGAVSSAYSSRSPSWWEISCAYSTGRAPGAQLRWSMSWPAPTRSTVRCGFSSGPTRSRVTCRRSPPGSVYRGSLKYRCTPSCARLQVSSTSCAPEPSSRSATRTVRSVYDVSPTVKRRWSKPDRTT